ncbi:MAG TPA: cation diffusion facilitator family transporter [Bryobacteraceae bacterium]|nr:cation diffusion facilitator family transporter [Bryobacteraceae bacterium]
MRKARRIAIIGMVVSGLLALIKITAGWRAGSSSVLADGFESAADVFASGLVLVGLIIAARPADHDHPYGHGRVETLTGLLIGFFLLIAGGLIAWHGITGASDALVPAWWALIPLVVSIAAKCGLVALKYRHGKAIGSESLVADAANDAIDILSGLVALGALSLTLWSPERFRHADHYGAFAVGLIVMVTAVRVTHNAALHLMDTMPDDSAVERIRQTALSVANVRGVEKCFARKTGLKYHVDLHLEVDPDISVRDGHEIAQNVRERMKERLPWVADVLVHVEPWPGVAQPVSPPRSA